MVGPDAFHTFDARDEVEREVETFTWQQQYLNEPVVDPPLPPDLGAPSSVDGVELTTDQSHSFLLEGTNAIENGVYAHDGRVANANGDTIIDSLNIQYTHAAEATATIEFTHVSNEHDRILGISDDDGAFLQPEIEIAPGTAFISGEGVQVRVGDRIYIGYDHGRNGDESHAVVMVREANGTYRVVMSRPGDSTLPPDQLHIATVTSVNRDSITFDTDRNAVYFDPAVQRFPENAPPSMVPYFTISSEKFDKSSLDNYICVKCGRTDRALYTRILMPDYDIVDGMMKPIEDFSKCIGTSICTECQKDHPLHTVKSGDVFKTNVLQSMKDWGEACQTKRSKENEERSAVQGATGQITSPGARLPQGSVAVGQEAIGSRDSGAGSQTTADGVTGGQSA